MKITEGVARHISASKFEQLSAADVQVVKNHILYTTGTILAGSRAPGIAPLLKAMREIGAGSHSSVIAHDERLLAPQAAMVNAAMAHARELDINDDRIAYKTSVAVVPALWALAEKERPVSGREFMLAAAVGIDLGVRLGLATEPKPAHAIFHTYGPMAAAAACARMLRLEPVATHDALGAALCHCVISGQSLTSPSLTKRLTAGIAAQAGVSSAIIGRAGFPATTELFAGPDGFFRSLFKREGDHAVLLDELGRRFEIHAAGAKPFPSCRYTHPAVEAALVLKARHAIDPAAIRSIRVRVGDRDLRTVWGADEAERTRRAAPQGIVDAQFSIPYTVATALLRGNLTLADFTDEAMCARDTLALAALVRHELDPSFDQWPNDVRPQEVQITLADGSTVTERMDQPKGSPAKPFSSAEIDQAFFAMAAYAPGIKQAALEQFVAGVRSLESSDDASSLLALLKSRDR